MMKHFSKAVLASLVVTIPALNAYPNDDISVFSVRKSSEIPDLRNLSYDEVVALLALIESDSFEERCSMEELNQANQLLAFLAMEGATENEKFDVAVAVASLFKTDDCQYAYRLDSNVQYVAQPAIFRGAPQNTILCKSWCKKQWDQTRKFVKKHKKEIIIGAIIVVAVTVVVVAAVVLSSASAAGAAAGGIATSAGALDSGSSCPHPTDNSAYSEPEQTEPSPEESLTSSLQEQISAFKEVVAQEQLAAVSESSGISMEENGRLIGSLFTHQTIDTLTAQVAENPFLGYELQNLGNNLYYPPPQWAGDFGLSPHASTDLAFSTNYSPACLGNNTDLNILAYETRGDWALSSGYYDQAVLDFGRALEIEPNNPNSYLGRGLANFELGHYEESITDYNNYVSQAKEPFSVTDFSIGFAKGLPQGIYDSGEGMLLFVTDLARHPIQTSEKVYDSLTTLSGLAKSGEWALIGEALSPELHQLVSEWDILSPTEKGELSGYAFGKHGTDILLPGAATKVVTRGTAVAQELGTVYKNLQSAQKVLVLEAVAEGGYAGINVGEVVASTNRALAAGEELGFTTKEMATLKQSGELEQVVGKGRDFFVGNPEMQASYDLFKGAQETLKPYIKQSMPETKIRSLIHESGVSTFPKPAGIPDNYLVRITDKGAGMEYVHPTKEKTSIRVMPGIPHSPNPSQQGPYIVHLVENKAVDKLGNFVSPKSVEAHIPLNEFVYQENVVYGYK